MAGYANITPEATLTHFEAVPDNPSEAAYLEHVSLKFNRFSKSHRGIGNAGIMNSLNLWITLDTIGVSGTIPRGIGNSFIGVSGTKARGIRNRAPQLHSD